MTEYIVTARNTFLNCGEKRRLNYRRSFSDSNLATLEEDTPIYSIKEQEEVLWNEVSDFFPCPEVESNRSLQRSDTMNTTSSLSELTIQNLLTGEKTVCKPTEWTPRTRATEWTPRTMCFSEWSDSSPPSRDSTPNMWSWAYQVNQRLNSPQDVSPRTDDPEESFSTDSSPKSHSPRSVSSKSQRSGRKPIRISEIAAQNPTENKTTVMLRNIPCRYSQEELLDEVDKLNMPVNFLYLPPARHSPGNLGYSFINFVSAKHAESFIKQWDGHVWFYQPKSKKRGAPCYATLQGFRANVDYYSRMKVSRCKNRPYINYEATVDGVQISEDDMEAIEELRLANLAK